LLSALTAIVTQTTDYFEDKPLNLESALKLFYNTALSNDLDDTEFSGRVEAKIAYYQRSDKKMKEKLEKISASNIQPNKDCYS
jgi:hypothetical protein